MKNLLKTLLELLLITLGCGLTAFGTNEFIIPSHLLAGGLTGICIIIYHYTNWPVGTQYMLFNIPLLVLGYIYIGKRFSFYTVYAVVMLSLFLNILHINKFFTHDVLLNAIFGGIVASAGSAIVLRFGGSSGGLDIPSRIIAKYKNIPMGKFMLLVNGLIVLSSAYIFTVQMAMYTLISIFMGAKTYESFLHHIDRISVMIITNKGDQVAEVITTTMRRGVTKWHAKGAYTQSDKEVLMCVVVNVQFQDLKQIVLAEDPEAFITVMPTSRVVGQFATVW
ncbi:YitT family protein [Fodinisporobacter ferrooxydans]|uniref:YitT family protein n=1 Tax=Fodinisporobacter ferrooxydans TaxID=2901836 RepID=A0ABY4CIW8_9BACL|nr:YitT family protein [Alicyclobacillaceae bacterium MYW30-H2]